MPASDEAKHPSNGYNKNTAPPENGVGSGSIHRRRTRQTQQPDQQIEIIAIGGEEGEMVHALQSAAVHEALLWLIEQHRTNLDSAENHT